jgi:hypothetical protein
MLPELEAIKSLFLHEWDPIGVSDCEGAEDEYDSYAMHVFTMLANGADAAAIGDYLNWVVTSRMSLRGNPERHRQNQIRQRGLKQASAEISKRTYCEHRTNVVQGSTS